MIPWTSLAFAIPMPELRANVPAYSFASTSLCYPSGLKFHAIQRTNARVVFVTTVIEGGHRGEDPAARGASHLTEHLWFQARPDGGATVEEVLSTLPMQGVTMTDANVYLTTAAPKDLRALLNLEAIRLLTPLAGVDEATVDREKAVVQNELEMRGYHVYDPLRTTLEPLLWGAGPEWAGQRSTTMADASRLTLEQLQDYAARWYRPENTTIRIEGAVDPKALENHIAATFPKVLLGGTGSTCDHSVVSDPPPDPSSTEVQEVLAPVDRPTLVVAWSLPGGWNGNDRLGEAAAFWLTTSMRYDLALVRGMDEEDVAFSCGYSPGVAASTITCSTPMSRRVQPEKAAQEIGSSLKDTWGRELEPPPRLVRSEEGVLLAPEWPLTQRTAYNVALVEADSLSTGSLASRALASHFLPGGLDPYVRSDGVLALQAEELAAFGQRWLTAERMVAVSLVPGVLEAAVTSGFAVQPKLEAPIRAGWSAPEQPVDGWHRSELPNGVEVWILPTPGSRISFSQLVVPGGSEVGPIGLADAFELVSWPVLPPGAPAVVLMSLALDFDEGLGPESFDARAWGPGGNVDGQLFTLRHIAASRISLGRPSDFRGPWVRAYLSELTELPALFVPWAVDHHLYAESRAGLAMWEAWEAARRYQRGDVGDWMRSALQPGRSAVVITGGVEPEVAAEQAARFLGDWKSARKVPELASTPAPPLPAGRSVRAIQTSDTVAQVVVACRLPAVTPERDAAYDVLEILARESVSQTLRDQGGLYGLGADVESRGQAGSTLTLEAIAPPAAAPAVIDALVGVLGLLADGVDEDALRWGRFSAKVQDATLASNASGQRSLATWAASNGWPLQHLVDYPGLVDGVTAGALREALRDCIGREAVVYVGPQIELPAASWTVWEDEIEAVVRRF